MRELEHITHIMQSVGSGVSSTPAIPADRSSPTKPSGIGGGRVRSTDAVRICAIFVQAAGILEDSTTKEAGFELGK